MVIIHHDYYHYLHGYQQDKENGGKGRWVQKVTFGWMRLFLGGREDSQLYLCGGLVGLIESSGCASFLGQGVETTEFMGKTVENVWFYKRYKIGQRKISKNQIAATREMFC